MKANLIFGPPGCGKTTEITRLVGRVVQSGVPESDICILSFTKAAAKEIADRADLRRSNVSTIHSLAFRLAGISKEQVIGAPELRQFADITGYEISGANPDDADRMEIGDYYLALHELGRARMVSIGETYERFGNDGSMREFESFCRSYVEFKEAYGYVDFADMLERALLVPAQGFTHLFVDEAQDLSALQWKLIEHWAGGVDQVYVAGDDDQAIYVWGGAEATGMLKFAVDHSATVDTLSQSYRVPGAVHTVAEEIIANVKNRYPKKYLPTAGTGEVNKFDSPRTTPSPKHGDDCLILYRNHSLRNEIEETLIDAGVPYVVDSGRPGALHGPLARAYRSLCVAVAGYKRGEGLTIKGRELTNLIRHCPGVESYIKAGDMSFAIGRRASEIIHGEPEIINYLARVAVNFGAGVIPTVHMSTIHGSKGREAERVVLLNSMGERSMESMERDPDSEIRTFYVGATRSKHTLDIVYGKNSLPFM